MFAQALRLQIIFPGCRVLDIRHILISLGNSTLGYKTSAFPWRILWASASSVVGVLILMALVFFLRRFWLKRGNNTTCAGVSLTDCKQADFAKIACFCFFCCFFRRHLLNTYSYHIYQFQYHSLNSNTVITIFCRECNFYGLFDFLKPLLDHVQYIKTPQNFSSSSHPN